MTLQRGQLGDSVAPKLGATAAIKWPPYPDCRCSRGPSRQKIWRHPAPAQFNGWLRQWAYNVVPQVSDCHVDLNGTFADGQSMDASGIDVCADKTLNLTD